MWRLYDWACPECDRKFEQLANDSEGLPSAIMLDCPEHGEVLCTRAPSLPGPYCGEKTFNPMVSGGSWDTTGNAPQVEIPDLPGAKEFDAGVASKISEAIDAGLTGEDLAAARAEATANAPSIEDYATHLGSAECKEIMARNDVISDQNQEKKARLGAINRGENINMRRDKCAGDVKNLLA